MASAKQDLLSRKDVLEHLRFDPDTGHFYWLKAGRSKRTDKPAGTISKRSGHVAIGLKGRYWLAHRLAWLVTYGDWPTFELDHINQQPDDNRPDNLRLATRSQNQANIKVRPTNRLGVKGVKITKSNRYEARIRVNRKAIQIGTFDTIEQAAAAYLAKAQSVFGAFASAGV